jgi:hypothetical protein
VKIGRVTHGGLTGPTGRAAFRWDNKGVGVQGPLLIETKLLPWDQIQPLPQKARGFETALDELAKQLTQPDKQVEIALLESLEKGDVDRRILSVRCLGAIDAAGVLLDLFAREEAAREDVRLQALFVLQQWLARGAEQGRKLYDPKTKSGMLPEKNYSEIDSEIILSLLYGPSLQELEQKETYASYIAYLRHSKLLVRQLAIWDLRQTVPGVNIPFDPSSPKAARERGYEEWKKILDAGKLPPPLPK